MTNLWKIIKFINVMLLNGTIKAPLKFVNMNDLVQFVTLFDVYADVPEVN